MTTFSAVFIYQNEICTAFNLTQSQLNQLSDNLFSFSFLLSSQYETQSPIWVVECDKERYEALKNEEYEWQPARQILPIQHHAIDTNPTKLPWNMQAKALHIFNWLKNMNFCANCGQRLVLPLANIPINSLTCHLCKKTFYPNISPCVIGLITRENELLLARHLRSGDAPIYTLIAGFIEAGESLEEAFKRETIEECGLHIEQTRYIASQPWPFPNQLMLGVQANYQSGEIIIDETELLDAKFFRFDQLPLLPSQGTLSRFLIDRFVAQHLL